MLSGKHFVCQNLRREMVKWELMCLEVDKSRKEGRVIREITKYLTVPLPPHSCYFLVVIVRNNSSGTVKMAVYLPRLRVYVKKKKERKKERKKKKKRKKGRKTKRSLYPLLLNEQALHCALCNSRAFSSNQN